MVSTRSSTTRRALFICGSTNQTTQMLQVARALSEFAPAFTPYYGTRALTFLSRHGFDRVFDPTIMGARRRALCLEQLRGHGVELDCDGARGGYDLVVTCSDVIVPENIRRSPLVLVQEGMTDPDTWLSRAVQRFGLPTWLAGGTTLTGLSGHYDRFCVASKGYRDLFVARGARPEKLAVTGIPNFDDCQRYADQALPYRNYVLACTSDLRETLRRDDRRAFIERVNRIAGGRTIRFKLHPNEHVERARREIARWSPRAFVHVAESTEALIAHCDVLVTQVSSVVYVGIALGKEVHSDIDVATLRRLCPVQNGATSAANIAEVCRELARGATRAPVSSTEQDVLPEGAS